jgi:anhydro-N-acetylmuramic acid kinase
MSGTSIDAIDSAIVEICGLNTTLVATHSHPIPSSIQHSIATLSHPGDNEIERMGQLDRQLGQLFAQATLKLLADRGIDASHITAIGSHGQTVRHVPASSGAIPGECFTLQIGDPNTITEMTNITTVADFRRRDIAAGGEGAPLAPAFHAAALSKTGTNRCIVNIGGIANATLLEGEKLVAGFDTGPGNTLMDNWHARHMEGPFDNRGSWAASGTVQTKLLNTLLEHSYFQQPGPKSTGKELFNLDWLNSCLQHFEPFEPADVQATITELTATSISRSILFSDTEVQEIYVCGGGAHNNHLMSRLAEQLAPAHVSSTSDIGIDPDWVEAMTFAWLASQTLKHIPGNAPQVTGAAGPRVLGATYSA